MTTTPERRTLMNNLIDSLTKTNTELVAINSKLLDLTQNFALFSTEQISEHKQIQADLLKLSFDMYGNGKKGIKEMITRLWEDYVSFKSSYKTIIIAIIIMIITNIFTIFYK